MGSWFSKESDQQRIERENKAIEAANRKIEKILKWQFNVAVPTTPSEQKRIPKLTILVVGLLHSGKSSLVNSIMRVLRKEFGEEYQFYANTSNTPNDHGTTLLALYRALSGLEIEVYDCKAPNEGSLLEEMKFFKACLTTGLAPGSTVTDMKPDETCKINSSVLVVSPDQLNQQQYQTRLRELVRVLTVEDRPPIVVISHQDELGKNGYKTEAEYRQLVSSFGKTDQILFLENYVGTNPMEVPKRNPTIDTTVVRLLEMCALSAERLTPSHKPVEPK